MRWFRFEAGLSACVTFLCCTGVYAQALDPADGPVSAQMNLADGPVPVTVSFHLPFGTLGPAQNQTSTNSVALVPGLPYFTSYFVSLNSELLPFNIVGADPSLGASTTTVPTVIVPLKFVFSSTGNPTLDGANVVFPIENSPIFQSVDFTSGSVDLGVTQYGDALQRAEFWNLPGFSQNYHVLLGQPSIDPAITIFVPSGLGNTYALSSGGIEGVVDTTFFQQLVASFAAKYPANELPIFLTDNVYLGDNGLIQNCCILGYHSSQGPPATTAKTWIYAAYAEPGTFSGSELGLSFVDTVGLSHETAEWLNDPFVGAFAFGFLNIIPPASFNGHCQDNFETGDPLEGAPYTFSEIKNSTTYHLQDEVFLPWYLHTTPSFSANSWYTFQNLSAQIPLVVNGPASIAGLFSNTARLTFAPVNSTVTADVAYIGRGCPAGSISSGSPADPYLASPAGKIALIDRGVCGISLKIDAAVRAGAVGVLIGLVAPGNAMPFTYAGGTDFAPSLVITQAESSVLKGSLLTSTVNATISPANAVPAPASQLCGPG